MTKVRSSSFVTSISGNDHHLFVGNSQGFSFNNYLMLILFKNDMFFIIFLNFFEFISIALFEGTVKIITMNSFNVINEIPLKNFLKSERISREGKKTFLDELKISKPNDSIQVNMSIILIKTSSSYYYYFSKLKLIKRNIFFANNPFF